MCVCVGGGGVLEDALKIKSRTDCSRKKNVQDGVNSTVCLYYT